MKLINLSKKIVKKAFNAFGLDVVRINKNPANTLLGLKSLPIRTIIDVGANEGQFAKMIMQIFPEAQIYCFEPVVEAFEKLEIFSKANPLIRPFNIALGESEGITEMLKHEIHTPSSSLLRTTEVCEELYPFTKEQSAIKVKLNTLDKWAHEFKPELKPEILIKLDVQGYEDRVIKGGAHTFKMAKACILEVNLDKLYEGQADFKEIFMLLYDLDFRYAGNLNQAYANDRHVISIDAVFTKE